MVLEAVMVVVDNSEHSRNGDYTPTRYEAQADAVSLIFAHITQSNPESSVGLMCMGGKQPEVLVTLTTDHGKILDGLHRTKDKIRGGSHLATAIQVAGLALKHRQNKSQRQRVVIFNCSPIAEDEKALVKLAKKMKKTNVSIDFIRFGETNEDTSKKLEAFNEAVKSGEGSHFTTIPPGPYLLSDQLLTSPILNGDGAVAGGAGAVEGGGNAEAFEFGIDPSLDPELALALRMSMEEEKARVEKQNKVAEAAATEPLPEIKEEDEAKESLLDKDGNPGGEKTGDKKDDDAMDTA
ncbi:26S proteasome regulatory subunit S5A, multiubiquitin chain binding protein [Calycina marina]|uniref:26S proteasome regulatory subunit S5A, multiubiquitin chain binding protein n=1 Tax=Calycina marina TaxID=1763456 RepID=A0A9P7Z1H0_9HELO|nr:26S proteasome regulatory subunit S5A, multiubiquitin chain binding protein [Calycina marina]